MSGLKPCPFCGGEVRHRLIHGGAYNEDLYAICCKSCNVTMETDGTLTEQDITDWNTRAVPDVPKLVRYERTVAYEQQEHLGMVEHRYGEYVRYDQAAEMIAAKDKEIERLREVLRKAHASLEIDRTGRFEEFKNIINLAIDGDSNA